MIKQFNHPPYYRTQIMAGEDENDGNPVPNAGANANANGERSDHVGAKPPNPLSLSGNKLQAWKLFKRRWDNYVIITELGTKPMKTQIARLENCLDDDALEILEGFSFTTEDANRTVTEILTAFEHYCIGETNETVERYNLAQRKQLEGELFDKFLADVRIMIKSCGYCATCTPGIIRDRLVIGIANDDTREDLLKERTLSLDRCIDICRAQECASKQTKTLKPETVNKITHRRNYTQDRSKTEPCIFCDTIHRKGACPAYGKICGYCGIKNHTENACLKKKRDLADKHSSDRQNREKTDRQPSDQKRKSYKHKTEQKHNVHHMDADYPSDDSLDDWAYAVGQTSTRDV